MTHTDWGECLDTIRSMTGYCFFLGDSVIGLLEIQEAANSGKVLIRGTILSLSSATCELQLLIFLLQDLSFTFSKQSVIWCNNQSALYITNKSVFQERTKHLEIDFHVFREKCMAGLMPLLPLYTTDQTEDLYTKSLHPKHFQKFVFKLGLIAIFQPTGRGGILHIY